MNDWRFRSALAAAVFFGLFVWFHALLIHGLTGANAIPAYWRSINLVSGVSPLLPQVFLILGGYLWCWCTLRGLSHFGDDRPLLPKGQDLLAMPGHHSGMPMFSRELAGATIELGPRGRCGQIT